MGEDAPMKPATVQRYDIEEATTDEWGYHIPCRMSEYHSGEYVLHSDYDTLRAEVERLRAGLSDERIGEIYRETFNSMPDRARSVEKTPPLVIEFGRRLLAEACGRKG